MHGRIPSSMVSICLRPSGLFYEEGELLENNKWSFPIRESYQVQQSRKYSATDQKKSVKRLRSEATLDWMVRRADGPGDEDRITRSFLSGGDIFSLNPWDQFLFLDGDGRLRELHFFGKFSST